MVRGESGRIVLEIDPSQKESLYLALKKNGLTLKEWFLQQTDNYLQNNNQIFKNGIPIVSEALTHYKSKKRSAIVNPIKTKNRNQKTD